MYKDYHNFYITVRTTIPPVQMHTGKVLLISLGSCQQRSALVSQWPEAVVLPFPLPGLEPRSSYDSTHPGPAEMCQTTPPLWTRKQ